MKNWDSKKDKCDEMRRQKLEEPGRSCSIKEQITEICSLMLLCDLWKGTRSQQVMSSSLRLC